MYPYGNNDPCYAPSPEGRQCCTAFSALSNIYLEEKYEMYRFRAQDQAMSNG